MCEDRVPADDSPEDFLLLLFFLLGKISAREAVGDTDSSWPMTASLVKLLQKKMRKKKD